MGANISTVMVVVALATGLWWGFSRGRRPRPAGAVLDGCVGVGGCHARGRGPALAACSVAGSRSGGRGRRRASALAARSLAPLAAGGRARCAGRRAGARRAGAADGARADAAEAVRASQRRQRGLPLDGQQRAPRRSPLIRRTAVRSSLRRGTRRMRRRARRFRISRRKAVCRRRSPGFRPSCSAPSAASRRTRPLRRRSVPRSERGPCCSSRLGCRSRARQYTALCADLASRGFVVVALSVPYESAVSVLAGGRVVGQTIHPDVMGPPPHRALERLIDIRAADSRFALDQLSRLAQVEPGSPLAGHLDLQHVGIVGHSIGGATAVSGHGQRPAVQGRRQPRRQALRDGARRAPQPALPLDSVRRNRRPRSTRTGGTGSSLARVTAGRC